VEGRNQEDDMNGIQMALVGRLTKDPAGLRYASNGNAMLSFSVAVDDAKRPEGAPTEWARVTVWGEDAERLADQLKRGSVVYLEGRGKLRTWTTTEGQPRTDLEISAWTVQPMGVGRSRTGGRLSV
jgi:single-strand DNA-binding protein